MEETLTLVEKTAFLKSMEALASIPTEALAELAARAREMHFDPGDEVFREGEPNRGSFLVIDGVVAMRLGNAVVRLARAGMAVGELFLAEGEPHTTSASAVEHTHLLNVTTEDIFEAMSDYPEFSAALVRSMSRQVHRLNSRIVELEGLLSQFHTALSRAGIEPPRTEPLPPLPAPALDGE
jgi:CRP-like cAMP-binding protein